MADRRANVVAVLVTPGHVLGDDEIVRLEAEAGSRRRCGPGTRREFPSIGKDRCPLADALRVITVGFVKWRQLADRALDQIGALGAVAWVEIDVGGDSAVRRERRGSGRDRLAPDHHDLGVARDRRRGSDDVLETPRGSRRASSTPQCPPDGPARSRVDDTGEGRGLAQLARPLSRVFQEASDLGGWASEDLPPARERRPSRSSGHGANPRPFASPDRAETRRPAGAPGHRAVELEAHLLADGVTSIGHRRSVAATVATAGTETGHDRAEPRGARARSPSGGTNDPHPEPTRRPGSGSPRGWSRRRTPTPPPPRT